MYVCRYACIYVFLRARICLYMYPTAKGNPATVPAMFGRVAESCGSAFEEENEDEEGMTYIFWLFG